MNTSEHDESGLSDSPHEFDRRKIFERQPILVRAVRSFWRINPFVVLGISFVLGAVPLILAAFVLPVGDVNYYMPISPGVDAESLSCDKGSVENGDCAIKKQVGYAYAINWWPTLAILMPFALFFAFTSVQSMQRVFARMLEQRMFCSRDWSFSTEELPGSTLSGLKRLVRHLWMAFAISGFFIMVIVTGTVAVDWYCVVRAPLEFGDLLTEIAADERPVVCQNVSGQEIDWSISAIFGEANSIQLPPDENIPDKKTNLYFSTYVYSLLLVEMNIVLVYFCFIFALALSVYRLRLGHFGIRVVPNLKSGDPLNRKGFENFEPVLQPCIFVTILSFIMAFLMRIQNEYLRSEEPGNIFRFMFSAVPDAVSADGAINSVAELVDIGKLADPNSQVGGPAIIIVFALVSIALAFILRRAARDSADDVYHALENEKVQQKVVALYADDEMAVKSALGEISVWPLSWPRLRQMLFLAAAGIACFFFYKLAFIWIAIVLVRMVQTEFSGKKE